MLTDLGVLETLLETSRRDSSDYPLYLAATLLETLVEHCADKLITSSLANVGSVATRPFVLSLDSVVPHEPLISHRFRQRHFCSGV